MLDQIDIWKIAAGLALFLFGLFFVEDALKNLTGGSFKRFLRRHTTNPLKGILAGTFITAVLQSSTVVTLMVLAFVGAGVITLRNALGVVIGSNLGTTFTGWIVATFGFQFDIENFTLPLIAIGGLAFIFFSKQEKLREGGRFIIGFGLLFMGLDFMKSSISQLAETFDISIFADYGILAFFAIGFVLTAIIQSSSASMVIVLSALHSNIITLENGAAMVIGSDLGTTITVVLGALHAVPAKKRVALSHVLFNLVTDLAALALLPTILYFIQHRIGLTDTLYTLVAFHSAINVLGIVIWLPFLGPFARFLERRFQEQRTDLAQFIHKVPPSVPEAALEALSNELRWVLEEVLVLNLEALGRKNSPLIDRVTEEFDIARIFGERSYPERYEAVKELEGEIIEYHLEVEQQKLTGVDYKRLHQLVQALRSAVSSAKGFKDVSHNFRDFERTPSEAINHLSRTLIEQTEELYTAIDRILNHEQSALYLEILADLRQQNKRIFENFLEQIYHYISTDKISDVESSTLLNVNQELYYANRGLIYASKDLLLAPLQAEDFENVAR